MDAKKVSAEQIVNLPCLVLNADLSPVEIFPKLATIPTKDAIPKVLSGNCYVVAEYDRKIGCPSVDMRWPAVVARTQYDKWEKHPHMTRELLFLRDNGSCAYCGQEFRHHNELEYEHVYPKKLGGKKDWSNIVAACTSCNSRKGHKLPEGQWKPKTKPYVPSFWDLFKKRKKYPLVLQHRSWEDFFPEWEGGLIIREPSWIAKL